MTTTAYETPLETVDELPEPSVVEYVCQEYGRHLRTSTARPRITDICYYVLSVNVIGYYHLTSRHGAWLQKARGTLARDIEDVCSTLSDGDPLPEHITERQKHLNELSKILHFSQSSLQMTVDACAYKSGIQTHLDPPEMLRIGEQLGSLTVDMCLEGAHAVVSSFPDTIRQVITEALSSRQHSISVQSGWPLLSQLDRLARFGPLRGLSDEDMCRPWEHLVDQSDLQEKLTRFLRDTPFDTRCLLPPKSVFIPDRRNQNITWPQTIRSLYKAVMNNDQAYTTFDIESAVPRLVLTGPEGSNGPLICTRRMNLRESQEYSGGDGLFATDNLESSPGYYGILSIGPQSNRSSVFID